MKKVILILAAVLPCAMGLVLLAQAPQQPMSFFVTSAGLKELKAELKALVEVKWPELIDRVATARAHGDLSENLINLSQKKGYFCIHVS